MTDSFKRHGEPSLPTLPQRRLHRVEYSPWVRAQGVAQHGLFWLPVSGFPMIHDERSWLSEFVERLSDYYRDQEEIRTETFLQFKTLSDASLQQFIAYRQRCSTLMGLGREPGAALPQSPTEEQVREARDRKEPFDYREWVGEYTYWFLTKKPKEQRELFGGLGGMTVLFLPPDPKSKAPPMPFTAKLRAAHPAFQAFDIDASHEALYAMGDAFLLKSKKIFGAGLEENFQFAGLAFVLPLLDTGHFIAADALQQNAWFDLFSGYLRESPKDKGIVFACTNDVADGILSPLLEQMTADGWRYPNTSYATS